MYLAELPMAPWSLRYPRCPKRAIHFLPVFSNKALFGLPPLASSYSRVMVSSVFCTQNIYIFGPSVWGPVKCVLLLVFVVGSSDGRKRVFKVETVGGRGSGV